MDSDPRESSKIESLEQEIKRLKQELDDTKLKLQKESFTWDFSNTAFTRGMKSLIFDGINDDETIRNFDEASIRGNHFASIMMGLIIQKKAKNTEDIDEAIKYYEKAASQGNPKGYISIGITRQSKRIHQHWHNLHKWI